MLGGLNVVEGLGDDAARAVPVDDAELRARDEEHEEARAMLVVEVAFNVGSS